MQRWPLHLVLATVVTACAPAHEPARPGGSSAKAPPPPPTNTPTTETSPSPAPSLAQPPDDPVTVTPAAPGAVPAGRALPIEQRFGQSFGFGSRGFLRITTAEVWQRAWSVPAAALQPSPPPPAIDFSRSMIVAAFMGTQRSGGYAIAIDRVLETETEVRIEVTERSPGYGCPTTAAITSPFDLVQVPRVDKPAHFVVASVAGESCAPPVERVTCLPDGVVDRWRSGGGFTRARRGERITCKAVGHGATSWSWRLTERPARSRAKMAAAGEAASFQVDADGNYRVEVTARATTGTSREASADASITTIVLPLDIAMRANRVGSDDGLELQVIRIGATGTPDVACTTAAKARAPAWCTPKLAPTDLHLQIDSTQPGDYRIVVRRVRAAADRADAMVTVEYSGEHLGSGPVMLPANDVGGVWTLGVLHAATGVIDPSKD